MNEVPTAGARAPMVPALATGVKAEARAWMVTPARFGTSVSSARSA